MALGLLRRLHRSTSAPAKGPMKMPGSTDIAMAMLSTVAEPVSLVSHQTSATCTGWLPSREKICPAHTIRSCDMDPIPTCLAPSGDCT